MYVASIWRKILEGKFWQIRIPKSSELILSKNLVNNEVNNPNCLYVLHHKSRCEVGEFHGIMSFLCKPWSKDITFIKNWSKLLWCCFHAAIHMASCEKQLCNSHNPSPIVVKKGSTIVKASVQALKSNMPRVCHVAFQCFMIIIFQKAESHISMVLGLVL